MVRKADIPKHIIDTALTLAAERGWTEISLNHIALAAKLPLSEVYGVYASKTAILAAFSRQIDADMFAALYADATEASVRERLFDLLLKRFDALNPHHGALANLLRALCPHPPPSISRLPPPGPSLPGLPAAASSHQNGLVGPPELANLLSKRPPVWAKCSPPSKTTPEAVSGQ